jgi:hypothetical protein
MTDDDTAVPRIARLFPGRMMDQRGRITAATPDIDTVGCTFVEEFATPG